MGEPLSNYDAVRAAVGLMSDSRVFGLSRRHITVSTVGIIPRIRQMAEDMPVRREAASGRQCACACAGAAGLRRTRAAKHQQGCSRQPALSRWRAALPPACPAALARAQGVSLALSLHAPSQELRRSIVPSARAYPLDRLLAAVDAYQAAAPRQRVFVEYVMLAGARLMCCVTAAPACIARLPLLPLAALPPGTSPPPPPRAAPCIALPRPPGVNDAPAQAHELGALLQGRDVVVNLIPWNPVLSPEHDGPVFEAPAPGAVAAFQGIVRGSYGLHCTVRQEKGQDVAAACGQLVIQHRAAGGGGCSSEAAAAGGAGGGGGRAAGGVRDIEELAGGAAAAPAAR